VYSIQHYVIKCVNDLSHVSVFTNKTDRHDLTEILLKVAFNIIIITLCQVNIIHDENNFAKNNVKFLLDWQTTGCFHCHKMIDREGTCLPCNRARFKQKVAREKMLQVDFDV
jgi:hypothetical protein